MVLKLLFLAVFASLTQAEELEGPKTTKKLTMGRDGERRERMELTYWTSLREGRDCLKNPYGCKQSDYEKVFNGELSLKNVRIRDWNREWLQMRLAFDAKDDEKTPVYDVLHFEYKYDRNKIALKQGWSCRDGWVEPNKDNNKPRPWHMR